MVSTDIKRTIRTSNYWTIKDKSDIQNYILDINNIYKVQILNFCQLSTEYFIKLCGVLKSNECKMCLKNIFKPPKIIAGLIKSNEINQS